MAKTRQAKKRRQSDEAKQPLPDLNSGLKSLMEVVELTNVSAGMIAQAVKAGFVTSASRGKYQFDSDFLLGLIKFLNTRQGQLPIYDNAGQCSAATGIPLAAIRQAKRSMQLGQSGAISLGILLKACFASNGENWIDVQNKFSALREKARYERETGETTANAVVSTAIKKGLSVLFRQMDQRSAVDLPPVLEGLSAADMKRELLRSDDELKRRITEDWSVLARNGEAKNGEAK